ncbi:MAG: biopolymer transporter ExbD [Kiritimatiellae bacterium]|nr:biopolymer transporter ExbD [Kiritimatiellia bacterium]
MARKPQDDPKLDMTPMIDVVFELIIFFVVTIKQEDMFTKLNANRPAPSAAKSDSNSDDITVNIEIMPGGANGVIWYNKRKTDKEELDRNLREIARTSKKTPIIVKASEFSPHKALVDVLDCCYKNELFSVSIFTI